MICGIARFYSVALFKISPILKCGILSSRHYIATHSLYHYYSLKRAWCAVHPIWLSVIVVEGSNPFCKSKLTDSRRTLCTKFWSKVPTKLAPYQPADCGYINGVNPSCRCSQFFFPESSKTLKVITNIQV